MIELKDTSDLASHFNDTDNSLFTAILDQLPDFIFVKDTNSNFLFNNKAHLEVLGCKSRDEVVGKSDFDFFPESLAHYYFQDESQMFASGIPVVKIEQTITPDEDHIWLSTIKTLIKNVEHEPIGLMGISRKVPSPLADQGINDIKEQINAVLHRSLEEGGDVVELKSIKDDTFGMLDNLLKRYKKAEPPRQTDTTKTVRFKARRKE